MSVENWHDPVAARTVQASADRRPFPGRASLRLLSTSVGAELVAVVAILGLAAGLRLAWVQLMPIPPESDYATFYQVARMIAAGAWEPNSYGWLYGGPGYPLVLAPLLALGGDLLAIRLAHVVMQLAMVLCVWLLGRRLFGPGAALAGAMLAALFPGLWLYAPVLAAENFSMLLLTAIALLLCRPGRAWAFGLAGGLALILAYARPAYLGFLLPLALVAAWPRRGWRPLAGLGWYVLGAALVFGPIAVANHVADGPLFPLGAAGWQQWVGHNERATGAWFPAQTADDYPFRGLADEASEPSVIRAAQQKLALQFVVANPVQALQGAAARHRLNWADDRMGLFWTVDRAPPDWRQRIPLVEELPGLAQGYYAAVVALAAIGAVRFGHRMDVLISITLPLGYAAAVLAVAEGNGRYHVMALPLLCVLAGVALASIWSGSRRWTGLTLALVVGALFTDGAAAWLIPVVVLAPVAWLAAGWLPTVKTRLRGVVHRHPWRVAVAGAVLVAALGLAVAGLKAGGDQVLAELAAVDPGGWRGYRVRPGAPAEPVPLALQESDVRTGLRKVSYPDAALLAFNGDAGPDEIVGLERILPGLTPGRTYRFYLQVFDPAAAQGPAELTVTLNGEIVWSSAQSPGGATEWRYISAPWEADGSEVTIRVERRAGTVSAVDLGTPAAVRSLHLYPKY